MLRVEERLEKKYNSKGEKKKNEVEKLTNSKLT